ncbi:MAG: hypothetical protein PHV63_04285 [Candidatus Daviesbacteria bacterium]|nr:hypothetical protein [Candidatus Daviesbacteria bacterium]
MLITDIFLYLSSFIAIWLGAGLIIKSVDRIAHKLRLSSFAVSFFILGLLTSIPETAVSLSAVAEGKPEIFVGTLLGGVVVIYLLVIPILAILGKGIKINHQLDKKNLALALAVTAAPGLLVIDHKVTNLEGLLLIGFYLTLFYFVQRKHGVLDSEKIETLNLKVFSFLDLLKVMLGIGIVFVSSQFIVDRTVLFSQQLNIPAFYLSLLLLSIGTNLPELSLAVRGILSGKKDIAFGDYIGSAAANTLLFGIFTIINDEEVLTADNFFVTFLFILSAIGFFYFFSKSKNEISIKEGFILIFIYLLFIIVELSKQIIR